MRAKHVSLLSSFDRIDVQSTVRANERASERALVLRRRRLCQLGAATAGCHEIKAFISACERTKLARRNGSLARSLPQIRLANVPRLRVSLSAIRAPVLNSEVSCEKYGEFAKEAVSYELAYVSEMLTRDSRKKTFDEYNNYCYGDIMIEWRLLLPRIKRNVRLQTTAQWQDKIYRETIGAWSRENTKVEYAKSGIILGKLSFYEFRCVQLAVPKRNNTQIESVRTCVKKALLTLAARQLTTSLSCERGLRSRDKYARVLRVKRRYV